SSPASARTMSGGRAIPARSRMCSSVASPCWTWCSNSSSSRANRPAVCSISVTSWPPRIRVRATFAPTLPPPAIRTYISGPSDGGRRRRLPSGGPLCLHLGHAGNLARADGLCQDFDCRLRRTDGAQTALPVEVGTSRVEDADDDAVDVEPFLRDLTDDDVRVVAVRGNDDRLRLLDAGLAQHLDLHAVTDDEPARPAVAEPRQRLLVLVDDGDVPTFLGQLARDRGADAAAADNQCIHGVSVAR